MGKENKLNIKFDKIVHTNVNGRRFCFLDNDKSFRRFFLCNGKDDTCIKFAKQGGLCYACGANRARCKGITKDGTRCPNQVQRKGYCFTHDPNPQVCQGVKKDGSPCTNRALSGGLCESHGRRRGKCPCGRRRGVCPICNPDGHKANLIRSRLRTACKKLNERKSKE